MNRTLLLVVLLLLIVVGGGALLYFLVIAPQPPVATAVPPGGVAGGGAGVIVPTPTPIQVTPVLIVVQDLSRGLKFTEEFISAVQVRNFPVASVPVYAIQGDPEGRTDKNAEIIRQKVFGKILRTDLSSEQILLETLLVDDLTNLAARGGDAALTIPRGLQAITIPINRDSSVAYGPRPGDYVDVIVSFLFVDVDEEFQSRKPNTLSFTTIKPDGSVDVIQGIAGRLEPSSFSQFPVVVGPAETQRPRLTTQRTIQGALVIQMGNFPLYGGFVGVTPTPAVQPTSPSDSGEPTKGPPPATPTPALPEVITIAVQPQDAIVLAWLSESRVPMTLTLRNPADQNRVQSVPVTLRYIVEQYQVQQAPKLPYSLEPAIRAVRQSVTGTLVPIPQDGGVGGR
jgi:pilus assembly protein CpaB